MVQFKKILRYLVIAFASFSFVAFVYQVFVNPSFDRFSVIVNIVILVLLFGIVVFVHEFGHFIVAKMVGAGVLEFSIGFGPTLFSKKIGETTYFIKAIPAGGYVRIVGEDFEDSANNADNPKSLQNKTLWQKMAVFLAGVTMNYLLAVAIFYYFLSVAPANLVGIAQNGLVEPLFGENKLVLDQDFVSYSSIVENSVAQRYSLPDTAVIKSINGHVPYSFLDVSNLLKSASSNNVEIELCNINDRRDCKIYSVTLDDNRILGIRLNPNAHYELQYSGIQKLFGGFLYSVDWMRFMYVGLVSTFQTAKSTGDYTEVSATFSTPILLYAFVDKIRNQGGEPFMLLTANVAMTLVVMNLLPIPALDGGRVLLLVLEKLLGSKYNKEVEQKIIIWSFMFLIVLMLILLAKDIIMYDKLQSLL